MSRFLRRTAALMPAVFFVSVAAAPLSGEEKPAPAPEAGPVTFAFYNLMNYLAMERRDGDQVIPDAPKPEREVKAVVEGLTAIRPDILGVCEVGDETFLADLQARLKAAGIDLPHTELVRDSAGWNRNVALLSRFPIVARNSRADYSYELEGTRHSFQRGVLDVTIAVSPSYHLRSIVLHLKSKREVPEGDESLMRLNEARLARQHLDRILEAEPGANVIVAGDLNALRHEAPIKTLQGNFGQPDYLSALTLSDPFGFHWTHYWSFADEYSRLDYALLSRGLKDEIERDGCRIHHWDDWDKASDHRPIVVKIVPADR
jgi:endonuclease/exonuclease/phosphatase family metal-dependent hydrolase